MLDFITQRELPSVLLIDDDMVSREVMATVLTMNGYPVHTAETGEAAVEMLGGEDCDPDVVLMDAQLPGLRGVELIAQIRPMSRAKVFAISASKPPDEMLAAADGFLMKPFTPEAMQTLLEKQTGPAAAPEPKKELDPREVVVNPLILAQLRELMPGAAVRQIYDAIIDDLSKRLAMLETAVTKEDVVEVRRIGHAIKGGCGMAGAVQAARIGATLEEAGSAESLADGSVIYHLDNSTQVLQDLRGAILNLKRMLELEFSN